MKNLCITLLLTISLTVNAKDTPNIIYILADDLGYGDLQALNPEGKITTPNLDMMVLNGSHFTYAHSSSAVCTTLKGSVLGGNSK